MHTPNSFRGTILHLDIKSKNIVLDKMYNARLIDFGLSRESKAGGNITTGLFSGTELYRPQGCYKPSPKLDYYAFGVVIREILTGLGPDGTGPEEAGAPQTPLGKLDKRNFELLILRRIWNVCVWKDLSIIADRCISSCHDKSKQITSDSMLSSLKLILRKEGQKEWTVLGDNKCEICVVNEQMEQKYSFIGPVTRKYHYSNCTTQIKTCCACMRNGYINPVKCQGCDKDDEIKAIIGDGWGAILIAGYDEDNSFFQKDVKVFAHAISSKVLPSMCVSTWIVIDPARNTERPVSARIDDAFEEMVKRDIHTLVFLYSGHHGKTGFQVGMNEYGLIQRILFPKFVNLLGERLNTKGKHISHTNNDVDCLCIVYETGPKSCEEIDTIETLLLAWNAKRLLFCNLRFSQKSNFHKPFGFFLENGKSVQDCIYENGKSVKDYLYEKNEFEMNEMENILQELQDKQEKCDTPENAITNFILNVSSFINWCKQTKLKHRKLKIRFIDLFEECSSCVVHLLLIAPGDAGFRVGDTVAKDKKRFEAITEAKADKYRASKQKNAEVMCTIDELMEWFTDEQKLLQSCESISCDPARIQKQLAEQKAINDDINAQKAKARNTIATGKRLIRKGSVEDETCFNGKMEQLKQQSDTVAKLGTVRLVQLKQALPMSRKFKDAHQDLVKWFQEVEPIIAELVAMSINQDTVKKQQDKIKILKQDLQDNKPLMDKLNKTGLDLTKLAMSPADVDLLQETMQDDNRRVEDIRRGVRERSMSIDEALQQSAEIVWDPVKKRWVDKNGDDKEETPTAPPPNDHELPGTVYAEVSEETETLQFDEEFDEELREVEPPDVDHLEDSDTREVGFDVDSDNASDNEDETEEDIEETENEPQSDEENPDEDFDEEEVHVEMLKKLMKI
ncbi:hypothetical protein DPMN_027372 [Dreissena polymorpha]|uniref:Protein kinase domain-containing protein n=1 Tax=Dreissena polymorpha TaxID=45954 RepID=A0A9D4LU83_DREPO|nr:hypothetical protein DPMN_027372 [Dreissena polymorpha]